MNKKLTIYILLPVFMLLNYACETEGDPNNDPDMVKIATAISENNSYEVILYASDTLFEGYNRLFLSLKNASTEENITDAIITLQPLMDMIDMVHSAPVENPINTANNEGLFEAAVVFIMPSTDMMGWTMKVTVNTSSEDETAVLQIPVVRSLEEARKFNVISPLDDTKYFVSLVNPMNPVVGINDCDITAHYKENMMSFPPAKDLTIEIEPEMPSMDHGSPNNENPVHTENGHYEGKINFTMTGWWRVHMVIREDGELITDEAYMDITLK